MTPQDSLLLVFLSVLFRSPQYSTPENWIWIFIYFLPVNSRKLPWYQRAPWGASHQQAGPNTNPMGQCCHDTSQLTECSQIASMHSPTFYNVFFFFFWWKNKRWICFLHFQALLFPAYEVFIAKRQGRIIESWKSSSPAIDPCCDCCSPCHSVWHIPSSWTPSQTVLHHLPRAACR